MSPNPYIYIYIYDQTTYIIIWIAKSQRSPKKIPQLFISLKKKYWPVGEEFDDSKGGRGVSENRIEICEV